ncbi:hypothetical protein NQ317_011109 [Molorchus minor]|uniref:Uncharacterized protein n=1 Tax=Molorchus minor TaxID=1323400 RepID=A0ABQ9K3W4_9CUCU|nr:hypothetical protein NQ317_011109 [Molorchus minor]
MPRLESDPACSPQSGHSSSTCDSPPVTASTGLHGTSNPLSTSTSPCIPSTNFTSSWSLLETQGEVKPTELK